MKLHLSYCDSRESLQLTSTNLLIAELLFVFRKDSVINLFDKVIYIFKRNIFKLTVKSNMRTSHLAARLFLTKHTFWETQFIQLESLALSSDKNKLAVSHCTFVLSKARVIPIL